MTRLTANQCAVLTRMAAGELISERIPWPDEKLEFKISPPDYVFLGDDVDAHDVFPLEQSGFVVREDVGQSGRIAILSITDAGRALLGEQEDGER